MFAAQLVRTSCSYAGLCADEDTNVMISEIINYFGDAAVLGRQHSKNPESFGFTTRDVNML